MVLAELDSLMAFTHVVVKGANVQLVASVLIAHDTLVLVRMVKSLDCGMTLGAFNSFRTQIPSNAVNESFAVFRRILENIRRSSEISSVMREVTALRVMRVLLGRTPTCLVVEHEEDISFLSVI